MSTPQDRADPHPDTPAPLTRRNALAWAAAACGTAAWPALAQSRRGRIRLVIPFAAGATSELLPRPIVQALQRELGQDIVIDNKPGAGGLTGAADVARAAPDGRARSLAVACAQRAPVLPDVPTVRASGLPALRQAGATVLGGSAAAFAEHNRREVGRWGALVKRLGVRVD